MPTLVESRAFLTSLVKGLGTAWQSRALLRSRLQQEGTDCFRVLQGASEGFAGVTVDAYGSLLLVQIHLPSIAPDGQQLDELDWEPLAAWVTAAGFLQWAVVARQHHRSQLLAGSLPEVLVGREFGVAYPLDFREGRLDPPLFLDTRCLRRLLSQQGPWGEVVNLFCYTNSLGLVAELQGGATSVLAVDFSKGNLERARRFGDYNRCSRQALLCEEAYPLLWQWAKRPLPRLKGRRVPLQVQPRKFDTVIVDPPQMSKGRFGTVDIKNDYPSLIRPCCEILAPGGRLIAVNNLSSVVWSDFEAMLGRSAEKSRRKVLTLERVWPESDFPAFDNEPPLKVALLRLA